ncbi:MAG: hypothetical protein F4073_09710 [Rhodobacteraceae bacterium]|nr:hypothetical protein [Paracoccaceae bacterium]MYF47271.1 hypothetical protein [Paracoccaceae bacterium]MYI92210.1 hypothetical protein [Paracoccaceae bacterium]
MVSAIAELTGATIVSYLMLRVISYGIEKICRRENGNSEIAFAGFLALILGIIIAGYALRDGHPDPQFVLALYMFFGPAMLATVIELLRTQK